MKLNSYQHQAMTTCMKSSHNFSYMLLNLVGEVGEFTSKVAKLIRKEKIQIGFSMNGKTCPNALFYGNEHESDEELSKSMEELKKEAGDILWQLSGLCYILGWDLEDVAQMNLDKLASRKERNVIDGNGDNR